MNHQTDPMVAFVSGGTHWEARPEYHDVLFGPEGLRLDAWLRSGQARAIKHGPHRTVYRITLNDLDCHLKHYRLPDTRAWLRELVRPSKARMEHDRALGVASRGVPTVEPLAVGERWHRHGPGDSFLVTRTLPNVEPLGTFLETILPGFERRRQTLLRQRLAGDLGRFLAQLHDAGIVHHDLHANNLLLRLDDDRSLLYLIDLHAVTLGDPLGWEASRANLVMLNRWFVLRSTRSDRRRCWEAYRLVRTLLGPEGHDESVGCPEGPAPWAAETARDLERRTWLSNLGFWRSRDRRCLANNRYYERLHSGPVVGHAVRELDRPLLAALLADPDEPFRRPGVRLLKDGPSSTVAELELPGDDGPRLVVYKRFRLTSWSDSWVQLCCRSPALRSWVFGHGLRERCLPTPRPLVVLHRRRHGLPGDGYLLMEKVPDAVELHRFVAGLAALPAAERRGVLRRCLDETAALVRELHRRRLAHRDLKAANVLVQRTGDDLRLWLIDLVGVGRCRHLPRPRRVQNLARLHASFLRSPLLTRTDKLRFLRVYLQCGLFGRERWKGWWREVEEATRAKVARNARSGRPLT
jgi:tRNA A-37 threonylcarbamoyl transferase component Bud32